MPDQCSGRAGRTPRARPKRGRVDAASRRSLLKGAAALRQLPTAAALLRVQRGSGACATPRCPSGFSLSRLADRPGQVPTGACSRLCLEDELAVVDRRCLPASLPPSPLATDCPLTDSPTEEDDRGGEDGKVGCPMHISRPVVLGRGLSRVMAMPPMLGATSAGTWGR